MNRVVAIFFILIFALSHLSKAQNDTTSIFFVTGAYDRGRILNSNDFTDGANGLGRKLNYFKGYTIGVGWQTRGEQVWHHVHNFPSFGIQLYTPRLDDREEFGQPVSLMAFYRGVLLRKGIFSLKYDIDGGIAMGWKPYDANDNSSNIVIGSKVTAHIGLTAEAAFLICKRFELALGGGFTHFSNGAVKKPNKGLNLLSPHIRLTYLVEDNQLPVRRRDYGKPKSHELQVALGCGIKHTDVENKLYPESNTDYPDGARFFLMDLYVSYLHQYSHVGKYGVGVNILYDSYMGSRYRFIENGYNVEPELGDFSLRFCVAPFIAHELLIGNISIPTHFGMYIYRPSEEKLDVLQQKPDFFQRMGLKYHLPFNMFVGVSIYAHNFAKADFLEWCLGVIPIKKMVSRSNNLKR